MLRVDDPSEGLIMGQVLLSQSDLNGPSFNTDKSSSSVKEKKNISYFLHRIFDEKNQFTGFLSIETGENIRKANFQV